MKHASRRERRLRIVQWLDLLEEVAEREEIPDQYLFMFIDNGNCPVSRRTSCVRDRVQRNQQHRINAALCLRGGRSRREQYVKSSR